MHYYSYQAPVVKSSTKSCEIFDEKGEQIGSIQRYFSSPLHRVIDSLVGKNNLMVRVKAFDSHEKIKVDGYVKIAWIKKPDYYIHVFDGDRPTLSFHAKQTNHTTVNAEFSIENEQCKITTQTDMFDWVRFYEGNQEIAKWHARISEKFKTHMEMNENASIQDPLFYAVLGHMLYFIGY
ncbi:tubby C-terminal domain-like protein [Gracilibacillus phocaeensis]|uniref:tubby C-terminal domain-like protein n=1 Tax=Gracilibacillus phocaeensis TaxID=2042304 RepID=UPI00102F56E6|nr:hypothetical protein [Gracilibacillus phocaeensis]